MAHLLLVSALHVSRILRHLFAIFFVGLLLAPTAAELCAAVNAAPCEAAKHACCEGPRLTDCECDGADAANEQSEPAQRLAGAHADRALVARVVERPRDADPRILRSDPTSRAVGTSERLSLLSTLLI
jgi:hypothetical protein